jgi:hypothetical protein
MSKKHFIRISNIIRGFRELHPDRDITPLVDELAGVFKDANPAFDKQRFLTACGF